MTRLPPVFSDVADPDPVSRLTKQATVRMQQLDIARTVCDDVAAAEAEWRLNILLEALHDIYQRRRKAT